MTGCVRCLYIFSSLKLRVLVKDSAPLFPRNQIAIETLACVLPSVLHISDASGSWNFEVLLEIFRASNPSMHSYSDDSERWLAQESLAALARTWIVPLLGCVTRPHPIIYDPTTMTVVILSFKSASCQTII